MLQLHSILGTKMLQLYGILGKKMLQGDGILGAKTWEENAAGRRGSGERWDPAAFLKKKPPSSRKNTGIVSP